MTGTPTPAATGLRARLRAGRRTAFVRAHTWVYRVSGGRLGARFGRLEQVLLTTTGRRSGQPRTTPVAGIPHGDRLLLVASNWGQEHHPAWFHNLVAHPVVVVRRGPREIPMRARVAAAGEREELWSVVVGAYPGFAGYARRAEREIPVVICEPAG